MVRSMTKRGMPKPFAILIAALLALYFVPLGALPASAADIGGFEIEGNLVDDSAADPPIDWADMTVASGQTPGTPGFSTGVDNTVGGQDDTTFQGSSKEYVETTLHSSWTGHSATRGARTSSDACSVNCAAENLSGSYR